MTRSSIATPAMRVVIGEDEVLLRQGLSALLTEVPGLAHKIMVNLAERVRELDERVYG